MTIKPHYTIYFLLLSMLIVGCTNKRTTTNDATANLQLNLGVMSSMDYLPLAVAQAQGYFETEGVTVTIHKFYSANERDAAFQSGNLDGTILDYTGAAIQRSGGVPLKVTSQCDGSFVLIASKDSDVKSIADLKGKKLAISRNTIIDFCTDLVLQQAGIPIDDVERVEINKIPLRLEMLRNGKIDATMLPDPFATIALEDGNRNIIDISDLNVHVTGIAFHEEVIAQKKDAIQRFYRAYNQAVALLNTEPTETFRELLIKEIGFPIGLMSEIKLPKYSAAQLPQQSDLDAVAVWLKGKQLVTPDFDIATMVATDLIP